MAINDVAGERVYHDHVWDILREFSGYNFVSGLRTLKSKKNYKKPKTEKLQCKKPSFLQPWYVDLLYVFTIAHVLSDNPANIYYYYPYT